MHLSTNLLPVSAVCVALSLFVGHAHADAAVTRAQFTTGVNQREPIDTLERIQAGTDGVFFFTELTNLGGHTITHCWMYDGEIVAEISFQVGGERWRVWSSKRLLPEWEGVWTVRVLDTDGSVLDERKLTVQARDIEGG